MAGNLDNSLQTDLTDIHQKIKDYPDTEIDSALNNTVSAISRSISKKRTFTLGQEQELAQLEKEVNFLQKEIIEKEKRVNPDSIVTENGQGFSDEREKLQTMEEIHAEIERIEEKIEMMQKLTGFCFLSNDCKILIEDKHLIQKQYKIQGLCGEIKFNIEFEVDEKLLATEDGKTEPVAEITTLTIYVPDEVFKELHSCLDIIVSNKSLHGFFRLLEPYSRWHEHRQETFEYFHQKYPDVTNIVEEDCVPCLILQNPKHQNGPVFAIRWCFRVNGLYRTQSVIDLGVQAPEELFKHDEKKVLKTAPDHFQMMLKEMGVERAIDIMIQLIQNF